MSSTNAWKSIDSLVSPASTPSLSQYPSQVESPRLPPQKYPLRRLSASSSATSIGGILDSPSHRYSSIAESGRNAISTLLQPPIVRTGIVPHVPVSSTGYKPPSSRDVPPVTLTNIPHVELSAFRAYLSQVGSLYDAFQQAREVHGEPEQYTTADASPPTIIDEYKPPKSPLQERRLSELSSSSRATSPLGSTKRKQSFTGRGYGHAVTPLSTIPPVYFEDDFHLENPRIFDVVSERSDVIKHPRPSTSEKATGGASTELTHSGRKVLATNAILQEKLSWYMDTVEIHLISSISAASKSFFTALGSLRELHSEASESVSRIQTLRKDFQKIDQEMALGGLKVVNLRHRRENVRILADAVSQLRDVVESVSRCADLVSSGNIEEAADSLEEVEMLMTGECTVNDFGESKGSKVRWRKAIDLRRIKALEGAADDLSHLRHCIGLEYETRFLNDLLGDLRRHVESIPADVTLQRWGSSFQRQRGAQQLDALPPSYMAFDDELRSRLLVQLSGLARVCHTTPAATSFKVAILREMKSLIRKHMPSSSDEDNESMVSASTHGGRQMTQQEKSTALARNLRALDAEDSYSMLVRVYAGVSESLRRLGVQVKVLLDIASSLETPKSPSLRNIDNAEKPGIQAISGAAAAQDEILQVLDMSSLLGQAVDIAQSQINKILRVRTEQTYQLPEEDFLKYFAINRLFADECEAISGRSGTALKSLVGNQIREYLIRFCESQRHRIVVVMDSDRWDAKDFSSSEMEILGKILDSSTKDIDSWTNASKIWLSVNERQESAQKNGTVTNGSGKEKIRAAVIDEQKYILPESAIAMMKSIEDFQFLMANIPNVVQDIALGLLESLKLFNSRSSQLILGAGATRSAGLKNITTRHLALSSQALSFIIALVPYIREFVRRHSSSSSLMGEFDKVKRLYQEHQSGIHEKLVDIMSSRSAVHVSTMKKIDWDKADGEHVNSYMETLTKETGTLYRVLSKHLPEMTTMMIMEPVFKGYSDQWIKAFEELKIVTDAGKESMLKDIEYFNSKMEKISGFGDLGSRLVRLAREKQITGRALPETEASTVRKNEQSEETVPADQ